MGSCLNLVWNGLFGLELACVAPKNIVSDLAGCLSCNSLSKPPRLHIIIWPGHPERWNKEDKSGLLSWDTYSWSCCLQLWRPMQSCCSRSLCLEQKWPSQNPQSPTPRRGAEIHDLNEHRFRLFFCGRVLVEISDLLSVVGVAKYRSELSVML